MLRKIDANKMGSGNHSGMDSKFHFSFDQYYNLDNMNFGVLRVLNDDVIDSNVGFDMHPHRDMEIVSYIIDGKLTHSDNMGNESTLGRGHVQFMSAGTGVYHSEHNLNGEPLRLLQIWIIPDKKGHTPNYGEYRYEWKDRENKWLHIVSSKIGDANIKVNQDVNMYALALEKGKRISFEVDSNRQAYLVQIDGESIINNISLSKCDALEIIEENINIEVEINSHFLVIEMHK